MSNVKMVSQSIDEMVTRLLFTYLLATDQERNDGLRWYDGMLEMSRELGIKYGYSAEQVSCVLSAHSMNCRWQENVKRAVAQLEGNPYGFTASIAMASSALSDAVDPFQFITGPKINPFARCGAGDLTAVATDRWAQRAAYGSMDDKVCDRLINRKGNRQAMIDAYTRGAEIAGIEPAQFQAIVWCVLRGSSF